MIIFLRYHATRSSGWINSWRNILWHVLQFETTSPITIYEIHVHSYETYIRYSIVICTSSKITFVENLVLTSANQLFVAALKQHFAMVWQSLAAIILWGDHSRWVFMTLWCVTAWSLMCNGVHFLVSDVILTLDILFFYRSVVWFLCWRPPPPESHIYRH